MLTIESQSELIGLTPCGSVFSNFVTSSSLCMESWRNSRSGRS